MPPKKEKKPVKKVQKIKTKIFNVHLRLSTINQLNEIKENFGISKKAAIQIAINYYYNLLNQK